MAVWMQIFGQNNFSSDIDLIQKKLEEKLTDLKIELGFLEGKLYPEISYFENNDKTTGQKINNLPEKYYEYSNIWQIIKSTNNENGKYLVLNYPLYNNNAGISIYFFNDVIMLTGLFDHFNSWFEFAANKEISSGYIKIAERIFSIFNTEFLYLCSEWCICGEEFNLQFSEFNEYIEKHPESLKSELTNLESYEIYKLTIKKDSR